jgi:translation initiation factor IF-3
LGVLKLQDAIKRAQSEGLDLVEVAPNANPPVCRIVDFGKFRYEQSKQDKEKKSTTSRLKEVKFRVKIAEHDYITKLRRAEAFLDKGNKVKVQLQFRGREMAHQELGEQLMQQVKKDLETMAQAEMEPKKVGRSINMTLSPLPAARRKRKYTDDDYVPDEDPDDHDEEQHSDSE